MLKFTSFSPTIMVKTLVRLSNQCILSNLYNVSTTISVTLIFVWWLVVQLDYRVLLTFL